MKLLLDHVARSWAHFYLPVTIAVLISAAYLSDVPSLARLIVPRGNRELGLMEMLQAFFLVLTVFGAARLAFHRWSQRPAFLVGFAAFSLFLLLEETDYGLFFYDSVMGNALEESHLWGFRNVHNNWPGIARVATLAGFAVDWDMGGL